MAAQGCGLETPGGIIGVDQLVVDRDTAQPQAVDRGCCFRGDLVGMLDMSHHRHLPAARYPVLAEERDQSFRDPHGNGDQGPAADADPLHRRDLRHLSQDGGQGIVAHGQGVAAGDQHLVDGRMVVDPGNGFIDPIHAEGQLVFPCRLHGQALRGTECDQLLESGQVADDVADMPAPVMPVLDGAAQHGQNLRPPLPTAAQPLRGPDR